MSSLRVVLDPGSTHMSKVNYATQLIDHAASVGAWGIKFQLFETATNGNKILPAMWWPKLRDRAIAKKIHIFASAFNDRSFEFLVDQQPIAIKIAYSKKHRLDWQMECARRKIECIVSCDVMSDRDVISECTKLYCIPEYPVRYQIDFENLFPRFHGFSSHTLGWAQDYKAVTMGARFIEKHITLTHKDVICPDASFAIPVGPELEKYMHMIRKGVE